MMKRAWMAAIGLLLAGFARADAPPPAGAPAPEFVLPDASGKVHRLADWRGQWLVIYFYPKDDTPGCTTEAIGFRDRQSQLAALKAQVVGVSLDDGASHLAFAEKHRLTFPLLVDRDGTVARRYGTLSDFGLFKFARRYTFLIDPGGRVAKAYLSVEASKHVDEVIADLRDLQK
jgi:peroxiredoxin Q/BCP